MNDDPAGQVRTTQLERVEEARRAISRAPGPDRAKTILVGVGAGLRRSTALRVEPKSLDVSLKALSASEIEAFLEIADVMPAFEKTLGAAQESAESMAAEAADAEEWAALALEGLVARDELASLWAGLDRFEELTRPLGLRAGRSRSVLQKSIQEVDQRLRTKVRWLVGINPARRIHRDLLDPSPRGAAWWFSERAACDDLLGILGGAQSPHLQTCEACRSDLRLSADLRGGESHLTADDLWDFDLGSMPPLRKRAAESHLAKCTECKAATRAVEEGNGAIQELQAAQPTSAGSRDLSGLDTVEVVGESTHFRVLLQRRMRVLTIVGRKRIPRAVRLDAGSGMKAAALQRGEWVVELEPKELGRVVQLEVELEEGVEPERLHVRT